VCPIVYGSAASPDLGGWETRGIRRESDDFAARTPKSTTTPGTIAA